MRDESAVECFRITYCCYSVSGAWSFLTDCRLPSDAADSIDLTANRWTLVKKVVGVVVSLLASGDVEGRVSS